LTVFRISPQLFFFIAFSAIFCANAALFVVKATGDIKIEMRREIAKWLFTVYILIVLAVTLFPISYEVHLFAPPFKPAAVNLVPFRTIAQTFSVLSITSFSFIFRLQNVAGYIGGNLLLLMPLGFLLPQLFKRARTALRCFSSALVISCCIEAVQFVEGSFGLISYHLVSIDNVILNVAGAFIGFFAWRALRRKYC